MTTLPSPCDIGMACISPSFIPISHGELFEIIFVITIFDICLFILLNVNVGESSFSSLTSPYGRSPDFIRAWNPLQIPSIRPSLLRSLSIASFTLPFFRTATINFADPSGSSPALNPPGSISICEFSISLTNPSIEFNIFSCVRLLNTPILAIPPSLLNALSRSYSQFVPGNTGINTLGFAILFEKLLITFSLSTSSIFLYLVPLQ